MTPEPLKKNHVFYVNLDGEGVSDDFPKDEGGKGVTLSDNWIKAIDLKNHKSAVEYALLKIEKEGCAKSKEIIKEAFDMSPSKNQ